MNYNVSNNTAANRFEVQVDGQLAMIEYRISGNTMIFVHTEVPKELEGKGIAAAMAAYALSYAQQQDMKVLPLCTYMQAYMKRHPEYDTLL